MLGGGRTLQVEVLGAHGGLSGDFGVDLDGVEVVGIPGDVHVVPVVVVQGAVGVALDQVGPVAQVRDVVKVSKELKKKKMDSRTFTMTYF